MAKSTTELSIQLENAVDQLIRANKKLKSRNSELEAKIDSLENEVKESRARARSLKDKLDNYDLGISLRGLLSHSDSPITAEEAKKKFSQMVREIDKCIALLKQ